jgi:hypothetical protein
VAAFLASNQAAAITATFVNVTSGTFPASPDQPPLSKARKKLMADTAQAQLPTPDPPFVSSTGSSERGARKAAVQEAPQGSKGLGPSNPSDAVDTCRG